MARQPRCTLLLLPAELRNRIYEELLVHDSHRTYRPAVTAGGSSTAVVTSLRAARRDTPGPSPSSSSSSAISANILRTCRQVHAEATSVLYGCNTFEAHPALLAELPAFLVARRPHRVALAPVTAPRLAALIRRYYVHVRLDTDPRFSRAQAAQSFSGVDALEIDVFQAMFGSCDFAVLRLFEGVRGVGAAVVRGSVGDRKYADWLEACVMSPVGADVPPFAEGRLSGHSSWNTWVNGNR